MKYVLLYFFTKLFLHILDFMISWDAVVVHVCDCVYNQSGSM